MFKPHWFAWIKVLLWFASAIPLFGITLPIAILRLLALLNLEQGVTNKRVIVKRGIIGRRTEEMQMKAIETVEIQQGIIGRILGEGNVRVTGRGISALVFKGIDDPLAVKRTIEGADQFIIDAPARTGGPVLVSAIPRKTPWLLIGLVGLLMAMCMGVFGLLVQTGNERRREQAAAAEAERKDQAAAVEAWIRERANGIAKKTAAGEFKPTAVCMADWHPDTIGHFRDELSRNFPNNLLPLETCLAIYHKWLEHYARELGCWDENFTGRDHLAPYRALPAREKEIQNQELAIKEEQKRRELVLKENQQRLKDTARQEDSFKVEAWVVAQEFVTKRLRSPGTASFGGLFDAQDPRKCVTSLGGGQYQVKGWVDSQNAFGASVRTDFSLMVRREANGDWSLVGQPILAQR